jgi:aerobic C4-dicarboxylate transport protein
MTPNAIRKPWYRVLYVQVLIAVVIGILVGRFFPATGTALKPLGDGFIKLVKMMIAPIIFCTVVHGIASMGDLKKLGRIGVKSLFYFEVVSTLALIIGLCRRQFPPARRRHHASGTAFSYRRKIRCGQPELWRQSPRAQHR